jgi:hypothetical protein
MPHADAWRDNLAVPAEMPHPCCKISAAEEFLVITAILDAAE